jgi:peptidyl-prolyl cis-trans isomerase SurA
MPVFMRIFLSFLVLLLLAPAAAQAQRVSQEPSLGLNAAAPTFSENYTEGVAAIVNDNVISTEDVRDRVALAMLSANLPNNEDVRNHLLPQALRALIDEQLQLQEGKKMDVTVTQAEITKALDKLSEENHIPGGDILAFIKAHGISPSSLSSQIKATLTWNKVVAREIRPRVDIGDDEIDAVVQRMHENAGKQEYLLSEIFLPVDNPKDEDQTKAFAEDLVKQIKGGASFGGIARQFSQSTGASTGGDMGWVQAGQLAPELDKTLQTLEAGEVAGPIRSANGFHILGVRERRTIAQGGGQGNGGSDVKGISVALQQAFHPFTPDLDKEILLKEADRLRQAVGSCDGLQQKLAQNFPEWHWQDLGEIKLAEAEPWLADKVRDVPVGHSSEALATDKGALILFVCGRKAPETIDRTAIMNSIGTERMELLARRLMRDLRRNAYIDVRLGKGQ